MHADTSLYAAVDCDDLVISSGAARLSAAVTVTVTVTAAWHGQRVIVVEKDEVPTTGLIFREIHPAVCCQDLRSEY